MRKRDTDYKDLNYKDLKNTKVMMKDIEHKEYNWKNIFSKDKWGI